MAAILERLWHAVVAGIVRAFVGMLQRNVVQLCDLRDKAKVPGGLSVAIFDRHAEVLSEIFHTIVYFLVFEYGSTAVLLVVV